MMRQTGVVITGIGVASPLGSSPSQIESRLIHPSLRTPYTHTHRLSQRKLPKEAIFASRSGIDCYRAASFGLRNAGFRLLGWRSRSDFGIVVGTYFGSLESVNVFDSDAHSRGTRYVNPTLFPNTVINAPAGYIGASLHLYGPNMTVCSGASSGLISVGIASDLVFQQKGRAFIAGGYEEVPTYFPNGNRRLLRHLPGDGAVLFVIENESIASKRRARIISRIASFASMSSKTGDVADVTTSAIEACLKSFGRTPRHSLIVGAEGLLTNHHIELIGSVLGPIDVLRTVPPVSTLGTGALNLAIALWMALGKIQIPAGTLSSSPTSISNRRRPHYDAVLVIGGSDVGDHVALMLDVNNAI